MKTVLMPALVVIPSPSSCGCGTILNLTSGDPEVYGGVQKDVNYMLTPRNWGGNTNNGGSGLVFFALFVAADAGLSLEQMHSPSLS